MYHIKSNFIVADTYPHKELASRKEVNAGWALETMLADSHTERELYHVLSVRRAGASPWLRVVPSPGILINLRAPLDYLSLNQVPLD